MDLAPVFEGDSGFAVGEGLVALGTNSVTVSHVQTSPVVRKPLTRSLRLTGTIDDDETRHRILSAFVEGRLQRLSVNFVGAEVQAGQPLALLYSPTLLTAVREYLALVRGSGPNTSLRDAAALRLVQLGLLPEQVQELPRTFNETNLFLEILSPMTGTVVGKSVFEGQTLTVGQPLFELADFDTMWLKLVAYETDLPWLRTGQPVEITSSALPGVTLTNAITFIDPNFDPKTRSTLIRVQIPNPLIETPTGRARRIPHRVLAEARVRVITPPVLTLPRSAVLDTGTPLVYVEKDTGAYEARPVVLRQRGDNDVEVVSGVTEGDRVVTQGALLLDAQAQLHQLIQAPEESPTAAAVPLQGPSQEQMAALKGFLKQADRVREALSADSLDEFNASGPLLHREAERLRDAFGLLPSGIAPQGDRSSTASNRGTGPSSPAAPRGQALQIEGQVPGETHPTDRGTGPLSSPSGDRSSMASNKGTGHPSTDQVDKGTGPSSSGPSSSGSSSTGYRSSSDETRWGQVLLPLLTASHLDPAPDLASARREFHPLSEQVVALARRMRALPGFETLKIYQCPMTRRSFEGAPAKAAWLQLEGPIRNPYFGAEMLDCGTEVRP